MPSQKFSALYGQTGVGTRFEIVEDPRRMIPLRPVGGMYDKSFPSQAMGLDGGSYFYPSAQDQAVNSPVSTGIRNLIHNGYASFSLGHAGLAANQAITLMLGGSAYDAILDGSALAPPYGFIHSADFPGVSTQRVLFLNGEVAYRATSTAAATYGAAAELLGTNKAGTVDSVTNGNTTITFTGSTLTTQQLTAGTYGAYVPNKLLLRPGDVLLVTQGASTYYHRIVTVTDATHLVVFPAWQGTTAGPAAGLVYQVLRTGYSSYSRAVPIYNSSNNQWYLYYAGNWGVTEVDYPSPQVVTFDSSLGSVAHYMGPQNSAAADVQAVDLIYYKNFLLYGAGAAVGWSVAGFPTSFTTGFGATDFPAGNITVVDNTDFFVAFEKLGDQLVAIFSRSVWLIQPTGSVPEFNFYQLPEVTGAQRITLTGAQVPALYTRHRPSGSARNSVYYTSKEGLSKLSSGGSSSAVSDPVVYTASQDLPGTGTSALSCTWEPFTDSILWHNGGKFSLGMYTQSGDWWIQQITDTITGASGSVRGMTGNIVSNFDPESRRYTVGYWHSSDGKLRFFDDSIGGPMRGHADAADWSWQSLIVKLPDSYGEGFVFGGFQLEGQNLYGVQWSVYGGNDPSTLTLLDSGTIPSTALSQMTSRKRWSKKLDVPYFALVFTNTKWAMITGANVYPAQVSVGK